MDCITNFDTNNQCAKKIVSDSLGKIKMGFFGDYFWVKGHFWALLEALRIFLGF